MPDKNPQIEKKQTSPQSTAIITSSISIGNDLNYTTTITNTSETTEVQCNEKGAKYVPFINQTVTRDKDNNIQSVSCGFMNFDFSQPGTLERFQSSFKK